MTHDDETQHSCCQPADSDVVRETAANLEYAASRTRQLGLALVALGTVCLLAAAGFSGYTALKAKEQSEFNERLGRANAEYQFTHAKQAQESFAQILDAMECSNLEFAKAAQGLGALDQNAIAACFKPPPEPLPPPPVTERKGP